MARKPSPAEELLSRRRARTSYLDFVTRTTPRFEPSRIHRAIANAFDRVLRKECDRLMIMCPPQHGKSTMASRRFPAYALGHDPTLDIISASATKPLAETFGGEVRNLIESEDYSLLFPSLNLSEDTAAKGLWNVTYQDPDDPSRNLVGGTYYAVGVGGAIMGRGANLGLIDDPFATWEDAQSDVIRRRVFEWYQGSFYNRIRPGGSIILIQHRMHEGDLAGELMALEEFGGDKWEKVIIPADMDDPPWPERYDRVALERLRANTHFLKWNALYMQQPVPEEGDYFKREWFGEYEVLPDNLNYYGASDFAVSEGEGDYTEHGIFGVDWDNNIYIRDWWFGRTTSEEWIERLADLVLRWKPLAWFGESGVIRKAVEPYLMKRLDQRRAYVRMEWRPSITDKGSRARAIQGMAAMGKVFIPKAPSPWKAHLLSSLLGFPTAKIDDPVDVLSLLGRGLETVHSASRRPPPETAPYVWQRGRYQGRWMS